MYKNKEEIEKIVDSKNWDDAWSEEVNKDIKNFIHQIRQDDLNTIKEMVREVSAPYINNSIKTMSNKLRDKILQKLDNLNKE